MHGNVIRNLSNK
ncbi:hypothetical protein F7P73_01030 [Acinetobacter bohemicus]|nr:hypothetical protein F7P73_01030 [Acinetobacter bohemicus]